LPEELFGLGVLLLPIKYICQPVFASKRILMFYA
jgi:hypothetical protein